MNVERLPQKVLEWRPPGRRRRKARSRNVWRLKGATGMREKEINSMEWADRKA